MEDILSTFHVRGQLRAHGSILRQPGICVHLPATLKTTLKSVWPVATLLSSG